MDCEGWLVDYEGWLVDCEGWLVDWGELFILLLALSMLLEYVLNMLS